MSDDSSLQAFIAETGESAFAVKIDVSGHSLKGDEPISGGGENLGPAPFDLLTAALGECTAMTVRWYAKQKKWPLDKVEVKMTYHKGEVELGGPKTDIFTKEVFIYGDALTPEQRTKLMDVAGKCPVHRTLEATPVIKTIEAK